MKPFAYYNEIDPFAAQWLRNLIAAGHIADGDVDERSITEVYGSDLTGYTQCHFFAGIGVWSYALRAAGWPDTREVWTGSCPCQPFSAAGKQEGFDDKRHLWPAWAKLIAERRPRVVFGEQVAAKAVLPWLDLVHADLEAAGYAVGAVDLCAAGVGAPHIRQRLFFVAEPAQQQQHGGRNGGPRRRNEHPDSGESRELADTGRASDERVRGPGETPGALGSDESEAQQRQRSGAAVGAGGASGELAYADGGDASAEGLQRGRQHGLEPQDRRAGGAVGDAERSRLEEQRGQRGISCGQVAPAAGEAVERAGASTNVLGDTERGRRPRSVARMGQGGRQTRGEGDAQADGIAGSGPADGLCMGHADDERREGQRVYVRPRGPFQDQVEASGPGPVNGFWSDADWLPCRDGKARPVEPGTFPLAHGAPSRVGRLRAYGNAIVAPLAKEFIGAYLEGEEVNAL